MSTSIDKRVVEMQFDNQRFERNVKTSIDSVDKLKKSLDFENSSKSLGSLQKAAGKFDMSPLAMAAETVGSKFSTMEMVALSAISNITNRAVDAGVRLAKSLSIDQIMAGYAKYDEKTSGVQTIMAATGKSIDEVSEKLEQLNWFTDETSYNFTDMVSNIGKFTSNSVELDTAVTAMEGIANWAAISGQNAASASRAMYNMAQAISVGSVKLMDWRSIENANMATAEFKQTVIDTAVELGTLRKKADGTFTTLEGKAVSVKDFNSELSSGWFSDKVLLKSLDRYGKFATELQEYTNTFGGTATSWIKAVDAFTSTDGDISEFLDEMASEENGASIEELTEALSKLGREELTLGRKAFKAAQEAKTFQEAIDATKDAVSTGWMKTFEYLFGDYVKAKELWTDLANDYLWEIFASGAELRNQTLKFWHDNEGYDEFIEAIHNILDTFVEIKELVDDNFLGPLKEQLFGLTGSADNNAKVLVKFTKSLNERSKSIKAFFDGTIKEEESTNNAFNNLIGILQDVSQFIVVLKGSIKGTWSEIKNIGKNVFKQVNVGVSGIRTFIVDVTNFVTALTEKIVPFIQNNSGKIVNIVVNIWSALKRVYNLFKSIFIVAEPIFDFALRMGSRIISIISTVSNYIKSFFGLIDDNFGSLSGKPQKVAKQIDTFLREFEAKLKRIVELIKGSKVFQTFSKWINNIAKGLKDSINNFKIGSDEGTTFLDKLKNALSKFKPLIDVLKNLFASLWGVLKPILLGTFEILKKVWSVAKDSVIRILSEIGDKLKNFDLKGLTSIANSGIFGMLAIGINRLTGSFGGLKEIFGKDGGLVQIFGEDGRLAEMLGKNGVLTRFVNEATKNMQAKTLKEIAIAIAILAASVLVLSTIDSDKLLFATGAILGLFEGLKLAISSFSSISASGSKGMAKVATSYMSLGVALLLLAFALKTISKIDPDRLWDSVGAISAIFLVIIAYQKIIQKGNKIFTKSSTGLISLSIAVLILAKAVKSIAEINSHDLWRSVGAIAALIGALALFSRIVGNTIKIGVAASLLGLSIAILILIKALKSLTDIPWPDLEKGLKVVIALIAALTAAILLLPITSLAKAGGLIIFATAVIILVSALKMLIKIKWEDAMNGIKQMIALLGIAVASLWLIPPDAPVKVLALLSFAASLLILAGVLKILSKIPTEDLQKALMAIIVLAGTFVIVVGALSLLAKPLKTLGLSLVLLGAGIAAVSAGLILAAIAMNLLGTSIAMFIEGLVSAIISLITAIPRIVTELAISIKDAFVSIVDLIVSILSAIFQAIIKVVPELVQTVFTILVSILDGLAQYTPQIVKALFEFLIGLLDGLITYIPELVEKVFLIFKAVIIAINDALKDMDVTEILKAIGYATALTTLLALLLGAAIIGMVIAVTLPLTAKSLSRFAEDIQPFISLMSNLDPNIAIATAAIASAILALTASSVLQGIASLFGMDNSLDEFGVQLEAFGPHMMAYYEAVKGIDADVVLASANAAEALVRMAALVPYRGGLTSLLIGENSLAVFGAELSLFGLSFKSYADSIDGINPETVIASANAAESLAKMAALVPYRGGLIELLVGENSLSVFGEELSSFGVSFKKYAEAIDGISPETVTASASAAEALAIMAQKIPNQGGLISWIIGDNTIGAFGEQLPEFGKAIKKYSDNVKGLNVDEVKASALALEALSKMAEAIPNQGGIVSWFTGDNTLDAFGKQLPEFGKSLKDYGTEVSNLPDFLVYAKSKMVALEIIAIMDSLSNAGGVVSWFTGEKQTLSDFGVQAVAFGESLVKYGKTVSDIPDLSYYAKARRASADIVKIADSMASIGGFNDLFNGSQKSLEQFGKEAESFGKSLVKYGDTVTKLDSTKIEESTVQASYLVDIADRMSRIGGFTDLFNGSQKSLQQFGEEAASFGKSLVTYGDTVANLKVGGIYNSTVYAGYILDLARQMQVIGGFETLFNGRQKSLEEFGLEIVSFADSMVAYGDIVSGKTFSEVATSVDAFKPVFGVAKELKDNGFNDVTGLKNFNANIAPMGDALRDYYWAIKDIDSDDILRSTSLAAVLSVALANFIGDITVNSENTLESFKEYSLNILEDAIRRASEIVSSDEYTPVIKPVVDLSDVESAAAYSKSLFSNLVPSTSYSAASSVSNGTNNRLKANAVNNGTYNSNNAPLVAAREPVSINQTFNYNQNLDRYEVYLQTRKGVLQAQEIDSVRFHP